MRMSNVSNVTFSLRAAEMQVVMDNPCSRRAVVLSDLLRQTFMVTRDLDSNDIRSKELSMTHVSKAKALHLLLGNLATNGVTNVHNEANAVHPSAFLPHRNLLLVEEQRSKGPTLLQRAGDGRSRLAQNKDKHGDCAHRLHHKHAGHNVPMHLHLCSDLCHHLQLGSRANPTHHHDDNFSAHTQLGLG